MSGVDGRVEHGFAQRAEISLDNAKPAANSLMLAIVVSQMVVIASRVKNA